MNIGMVLQGKFPPDIRVEKEARALIKAGHKIFLLAPSSLKRDKEEIVNEVLVRNIHIYKNYFRHVIDTVIFSYTFRHKIWESELGRFVKDFNINVIHIHDLPLVGVGVKVGRKYGIPIIADLHENYPAAVQVWQKKHSLVDAFLQNYKRWSEYERRILPQVDHIIVVVEEAKERLITEGLSSDRITIVPNTEDVHTFNAQKIHKEIIDRYKGHFVISYIGGFGPHRGIDCAIRAMVQIKERISTAKLLLIGGRGLYKKEMEGLVKDFGLTKYVEILGWQPFDKVAMYIKDSDICLVPHHRSAHTDTTIPHKLFQYMLMEKPVVVSDCRPLKRIVEETGCGLSFVSGDSNDLAIKLLQLSENHHLMRKCGENGKIMVLEKYNWQNTSRVLCNLYSNL